MVYVILMLKVIECKSVNTYCQDGVCCHGNQKKVYEDAEETTGKPKPVSLPIYYKRQSDSLTLDKNSTLLGGSLELGCINLGRCRLGTN